MRLRTTDGRPGEGDGRVFRPITVFVLAYGVLLQVAWLWLQVTFDPWTFVRDLESEVVFGWTYPNLLTVVHACLFVGLLLTLGTALRSAASVRRGQVAGLVGSMIVLAVLQLGVGRMQAGARQWAEWIAPPPMSALELSDFRVHGWFWDGGPAGLDFSFYVDWDGSTGLFIGDEEEALVLDPDPDRVQELRRVLLSSGHLERVDHPILGGDVLGERFLSVEFEEFTHDWCYLERPNEDGEMESGRRATHVELRGLLEIWAVILSWFDDPQPRTVLEADAALLRSLR